MGETDIINFEELFYKMQKSFYIKVKEIEQAGPIVWITMKESVKLSYMHRMLDEMLLEKYGVIQHTSDKDFRFHTSVLMINNDKCSKSILTFKDGSVEELEITGQLPTVRSTALTPISYIFVDSKGNEIW